MLEVIATSLEDALRAEQGGAGRLELVSALAAGGLTPDFRLLQRVVAAVRIPVNVMIRPHARGFHYREEEIEAMAEQLRRAREGGANGVVLGVLDAWRRVHLRHLGALLAPAQGLEVTFHRAIDEAEDPVAAALALSSVPGLHSILTSGGPGPIAGNVAVLARMRMAAGAIRIMAGGGLTPENAAEVLLGSGVRDCHFGTAVREGRATAGAVDPQAIAALRELLARGGIPAES